jgi:MurNAc alpha-1-phosphate uridylyltransferase
VRGRPLIVWHMLNLVRAGITEIVINHSHLGHMIEAALGDGSQFGARHDVLARAGRAGNGRRHRQRPAPAGRRTVLVAVSGDIYIPYFDFEQVKDVLHDKDMWGKPYPADKRDICWLYLVPNPLHNPDGDFG